MEDNEAKVNQKKIEKQRKWKMCKIKRKPHSIKGTAGRSNTRRKRTDGNKQRTDGKKLCKSKIKNIVGKTRI
jgi:hypothetical protein